MTTHRCDFPFEEVARFDNTKEALDAGHKPENIWSVVTDGDSWVYGPSRHYVNRLYVIVTKEPHDDNTYYEEDIA